jgi:hypothetical protein
MKGKAPGLATFSSSILEYAEKACQVQTLHIAYLSINNKYFYNVEIRLDKLSLKYVTYWSLYFIDTFHLHWV